MDQTLIHQVKPNLHVPVAWLYHQMSYQQCSDCNGVQMNNKSSVYHALNLMLIMSPAGGVTITELNAIFSSSTPTTKRLIAVARGLGAVIESAKTDGEYRYSRRSQQGHLLHKCMKQLGSYYCNYCQLLIDVPLLSPPILWERFCRS